MSGGEGWLTLSSPWEVGRGGEDSGGGFRGTGHGLISGADYLQP